MVILISSRVDTDCGCDVIVAVGTKGGVPELHTGPVFEPVCVYKMLQVIKYGGAFKVSQTVIAEGTRGLFH